METSFCLWWIASTCYNPETTDIERCGFVKERMMGMCRWDGEGVWARTSVLVLEGGGVGGYLEARIVIDWPGRTVMQIHSSRLMFCHSALSAIKLAPVLKSPADNVAEAEITLHFPCAFSPPASLPQPLRDLLYILSLHWTGTFPASWPVHHPWFTTLWAASLFFFFST